MPVTEAVAAFVREHREHGQLIGDAAAPVANGYLLEIFCPCGVVFARGVDPRLAAEGLAALVLRN